MTVTLTNADFTISRPAPEREQDIVDALNPAPDATADLPTALTRVGFQIDNDRPGTIRIVGGEVNPSAAVDILTALAPLADEGDFVSWTDNMWDEWATVVDGELKTTSTIHHSEETKAMLADRALRRRRGSLWHLVSRAHPVYWVLREALDAKWNAATTEAEEDKAYCDFVSWLERLEPALPGISLLPNDGTDDLDADVQALEKAVRALADEQFRAYVGEDLANDMRNYLA